jgi:hypothetical protein
MSRTGIIFLCNLDDYLEPDSKKRPLRCDECGRRFKHIWSLNAHLRGSHGYKNVIDRKTMEGM